LTIKKKAYVTAYPKDQYNDVSIKKKKQAGSITLK
jgi:hypothetical protein